MADHMGQPGAPLDALLAARGEMAERIRAFDWAGTPLGAMAQWPEPLRTAVAICLNSRFPMVIWWGAKLTLIYNDGWRPILGETKHPRALGSAGREIWPEIWDVIGPMFERVMSEGAATWEDNGLLMVNRYGYSEEAYFTWSYSPIPDGSGGVGGVFTAVTETTQRVIGERRTATLRELAARSLEAREVEEACEIAAHTLSSNPKDFPFALLYLADEDRRHARLVAAAGIAPGAAASPDCVSLEATSSAGWQLAGALRAREALIVDDLARRFSELPSGAWAEPPRTAALIPISLPGRSGPDLVLVAALNPHRALGDGYQGFLQLVAGQIGAATGSARAYQEARLRAEELAELDRAKTAFFSNVSHEFRTPLTLLLGPLEDTLAQPDTLALGEERERLTVAHRNAVRLLRLVNTLLDFSRIEAGRVQASYELTDLPAYTADLAGTFRSAIERAGLSFDVDCPPLPEGVTAYVDPDMWEKIVLNLLSNAFKFTFEGGITVALRSANERIELIVQDTGTGIPAEELPRLFERFHRVAGARGRTFEGTGIGLALVQELVKLHGGQVHVDSAVSKGTTMTVELPVGATHLPGERIGAPRSQLSTTMGALPYIEEALSWLPAEALGEDGGESQVTRPDAARPSPSRKRGRVLVADDNRDMRDYVARLLREQFTVEAAPDGQAALEAAMARPPDLVLRARNTTTVTK